jgi:hypothetical protein
MTDMQLPVHDGKVKSASLELVIAVLIISEGLDANVTSMDKQSSRPKTVTEAASSESTEGA